MMPAPKPDVVSFATLEGVQRQEEGEGGASRHGATFRRGPASNDGERAAGILVLLTGRGELGNSDPARAGSCEKST